MKKGVNFLRTIGLSFHPGKLSELGERRGSDVTKHFFLLLLVVMALGMIVSIPSLVTLSARLNEEFNSFTTLKVDVNVSMKEPVMIPDNDPKIFIFTGQDDLNLTRKDAPYVAISDKFLYSRFTRLTGFSKHDVGKWQDLLGQADFLSKAIVLVFVLMLPSLLILSYVYYAVMLGLLILLASVIALIIGRVAKFDVYLNNLLKVGVFALTPMLLVQLVGLAIRQDLFWPGIGVFALYFAYGALRSGDIEKPKGFTHHGK